MLIKDKIFEKYLRENIIKKRIEGLACQIKDYYKDKSPVFIIVMNGAFGFAWDLLKEFPEPIETKFIKLTSYNGTTSTGEVKVISGFDSNLEGKDLVIIEDIIDTGLTIEYLIKSLKTMNPSSIEVCTLLNKPSANKHYSNPKFFGFNIPDDFVVGYGLDYDGHGRNLTDLYRLK